MSLIRWDPFREMISLREAIDRLFEESFVRPRAWLEAERVMSVPLDIYEEGDDLIVKATVPGVRPEDLNVQIQNNILTISGETKEERERKEANYHLREHRYGRFERSVTLPYAVQVDKAEATFEHGVLRLRLPKAEEVRGRRIEVKVQK
ncbi:MAG: hypothetical protein C4309_13845 [Chloroflexota bacterium]